MGKVQLVSGLTLILYAVAVATLPMHGPFMQASYAAFSRLSRPDVWQLCLTVIGVLQIAASNSRSASCHIVTAYPAMAAFFFASVGASLMHATFDSLSVFALTWGILLLLVVWRLGERVKTGG